MLAKLKKTHSASAKSPISSEEVITLESWDCSKYCESDRPLPSKEFIEKLFRTICKYLKDNNSQYLRASQRTLAIDTDTNPMYVCYALQALVKNKLFRKKTGRPDRYELGPKVPADFHIKNKKTYTLSTSEVKESTKKSRFGGKAKTASRAVTITLTLEEAVGACNAIQAKLNILSMDDYQLYVIASDIYQLMAKIPKINFLLGDNESENAETLTDNLITEFSDLAKKIRAHKTNRIQIKSLSTSMCELLTHLNDASHSILDLAQFTSENSNLEN